MPGPSGTSTNCPELDRGTHACCATPSPGITCPTLNSSTNSDISSSDGERIIAEAATWAGTPYESVGQASAKGKQGDCSGTTYRIYNAAGFAYPYVTTGSFEAYVKRTGQFRLVPDNEPRQAGDILLWPGHMTIYATFAAKDPNSTHEVTSKKTGKKSAQASDMWTAPGHGRVYELGTSKYLPNGPPKVYRYQRVPTP